MVTTTIEISRLLLHGYHGVAGQERIVGNSFEISLRIRYPAQMSLSTDDVADTLNYAEVIEVVRAEMSVQSQLIEHVAGRIRNSLMKRFPEIEGGMIKVAKLCPPCGVQLAEVACVIEW